MLAPDVAVLHRITLALRKSPQSKTKSEVRRISVGSKPHILSGIAHDIKQLI